VAVVFWEKGNGEGVFGQTAFFLLANRQRQGKGGGRPRGGRPVGVPAGDPGHGGGREMGQNGEETEGTSSPCSPWAEAAWAGGSAVQFRRRRKLAVAARLLAVVEQGRAVEA
jgi:hypothetical protein